MGSHLGDLTADLVREEGPLDEPVAAALEGRSPREREFAVEDAAVQVRAIPLLPAGQRSGAIVLRPRRERAAAAGQAAAEQGRDDPRDPPPGQEQPADRRGAAAAAGPPAQLTRGPGGARGVGTPGQLDRPGARDAVDSPTTRWPTSTRSPTRSWRWSRRSASRRRRLPTGVPAASACSPAQVATPLALVLTELLQNAVEHGLGAGGGVIHVDAQVGEDLERRARADGEPADPAAGGGRRRRRRAARGLRHRGVAAAGPADRPDPGGRASCPGRSTCGPARAAAPRPSSTCRLPPSRPDMTRPRGRTARRWTCWSAVSCCGRRCATGA